LIPLTPRSTWALDIHRNTVGAAPQNWLNWQSGQFVDFVQYNFVRIQLRLWVGAKHPQSAFMLLSLCIELNSSGAKLRGLFPATGGTVNLRGGGRHAVKRRWYVRCVHALTPKAALLAATAAGLNVRYTDILSGEPSTTGLAYKVAGRNKRKLFSTERRANTGPSGPAAAAAAAARKLTLRWPATLLPASVIDVRPVDDFSSTTSRNCWTTSEDCWCCFKFNWRKSSHLHPCPPRSRSGLSCWHSRPTASTSFVVW